MGGLRQNDGPQVPSQLAVWWRDWRPALIATLVYLLLCMLKSGPVELFTGARWHGWFDQGQYLRSTLALAHGDLSPDNHWYPLLYPLLAVPFVPLMPDNPYLPLDLICVAMMVRALIRVAAHLGIGQRAALIILLLSIAWPPQLWQAWVQPWTTTLSAALIWWLMARAGDLALGEAPVRPRDVAGFVFVAALVPLARPADIVVPATLCLFLAALLARRGVLNWRHVAAAIIAAAMPILGYLALHVSIYGAALSDYTQLSVAIGTRFADLGWKMSILFVDPSPWFPRGTGLLTRIPWIVLGLAGSLFVLLRGAGEPRRRGYAACLLFATASYVLVLAAYIDLLPTGLWRFNGLHYFKWILPLLGLMAWLLVRDARAARGYAIAAVTGAFLLTGLRLVAVPAGADEAARRIDVIAPPQGDWATIYFARSAITGPTGPMRNVFEYRQVPDGGQIRLLGLRRDFAPGAKWVPNGIAGLDWPAGGPGTTAPFALPAPVAPVARWKTQLSWGLPCWLGTCRAQPL